MLERRVFIGTVNHTSKGSVLTESLKLLAVRNNDGTLWTVLIYLNPDSRHKKITHTAIRDNADVNNWKATVLVQARTALTNDFYLSKVKISGQWEEG